MPDIREKRKNYPKYSKRFLDIKLLKFSIFTFFALQTYAFSLEIQSNTIQKEQDMIKDDLQTTLHRPEKQVFAKSVLPNYLEDSRFVALPLFYIQAGLGATYTEKMAALYPPIRKGVIPLFTLALGYNQQFQYKDFSIGFKIQFGGEIGFQPIDNTPLGTNTETYYGANAFAMGYIGWQNILPYGGIGYEVMHMTTYDVGCTDNTDASTCKDTTTTLEYSFNIQGLSYIGGVAIIFSKNHALDFSVRYSQIYKFPKFLLNYEFRY